MKIKISNNEVYEIKLGNQLSIQEFTDMLYKLNSLVRTFSKNIINPIDMVKVVKIKKGITKTGKIRKTYTYKNSDAKIKQTRKVSNPRLWCATREQAITTLKIHYYGTQEQKERLAQSSRTSWNEIVKGFWGVRRRYNIRPQEVGLQHWIKKGKRTREPYRGYLPRI